MGGVAKALERARKRKEKVEDLKEQQRRLARRKLAISRNAQNDMQKAASIVLTPVSLIVGADLTHIEPDVLARLRPLDESEARMIADLVIGRVTEARANAGPKIAETATPAGAEAPAGGAAQPSAQAEPGAAAASAFQL